MTWDTTFALRRVVFPDEAILDRSISEAGNNYRLSGFFRKCKPGKKLKIGYIGGSITAGSKASRLKNRYSSKFCTFLGNAYPNVKFTEINAGIGSTNSRFGASRVDYDLLSSQPDLIIIEFAVNDAIGDTLTTAQTMEGLVRHCLQKPGVPVLIFQTMNARGDSINHGIQKRIAKHYGVPVIDYRGACWPLVASGKIPWKSISADDVHPNDAGHTIGGYLLYSFLKSELERIDNGIDADIGIAEPLASDLYEQADMLHGGDSTFTVVSNTGWVVSKDGKNRVTLTSQLLGDKVVLRSVAREASWVYRCKKGFNAEVQVKLDGAVSDVLGNHFEEDWGGGYLKTSRAWRLGERSEHLIELENLTGGRFEMNYVLYAP